MTEHEVVELMRGSESEEEWDANCDKVKAACGGYPSFWFQTILASGFSKRTEETKHDEVVCPACSQKAGTSVPCFITHGESYLRSMRNVDRVIASFADSRPVSGKRVGDIEVGAEHEVAIDELAKWCVRRVTDMELVAAGREWMLYRLDVPVKEAPTPKDTRDGYTPSKA